MLVEYPDTEGKPVLVDGQPSDGLYVFDSIDIPHALVYLHGEPCYDVEIWFDGRLLHTVPAESPSSRAAYALHEAMKAGHIAFVSAPQPPQDAAKRLAMSARVEDEIRASPGHKAVSRWEDLVMSYQVYADAAHEALRTIRAAEASPEVSLSLGQMPATDVEQGCMTLLNRVMFTFTAAAKTLVEHTYPCMEPYAGTRFEAEYERRKRAAGADGLIKFVLDLRNVQSHQRFLFVGWETRPGQPDLTTSTCEFFYATRYLSTLPRFTEPSKRFIAVSGDRLPLREIVERYDAAVTPLNQWLFDNVDGLHAADFYWVREMEGERSWLLSNGAQCRPRNPHIPQP